jgi:hypothetical protein
MLVSSRQAQFRFNSAFASSVTDATALPKFGPLEAQPDLDVNKRSALDLEIILKKLVSLSDIDLFSWTRSFQGGINGLEYKVAGLS